MEPIFALSGRVAHRLQWVAVQPFWTVDASVPAQLGSKPTRDHSACIAKSYRGPSPTQASGHASYNVLQRIAYMSVVFVLFPLMIWTGLAMSPAVVSVFPGMVTVFGGHQSARTIHFVVSLLLIAFLLVHIVMVFRAGFRTHVRAMITGRGA
jgi:thiosulfate reductase cytochrome b subunit